MTDTQVNLIVLFIVSIPFIAVALLMWSVISTRNKIEKILHGYDPISGYDDPIQVYVKETEQCCEFKVIDKKVNIINELTLKSGDVKYGNYRSWCSDNVTELENIKYKIDGHLVLDNISDKLYAINGESTTLYNIDAVKRKYITISCTDALGYDTDIDADTDVDAQYKELTEQLSRNKLSGFTSIFKDNKQIYLEHIVSTDLRVAINRSVIIDDELHILDDRYYSSDGKLIGETN